MQCSFFLLKIEYCVYQINPFTWNRSSRNNFKTALALTQEGDYLHESINQITKHKNTLVGL